MRTRAPPDRRALGRTESRPLQRGGSSAGLQRGIRHDGTMTDVPDLDLDRRAATVVRALPRLEGDERRIGRAIYQLMAAGRRVRTSALSALTGCDAARVDEVLGHLPTAAVVDGEVMAFLGLQRATGRHQLAFADARLATWCAWDTLFIPPLAGRAARAESRCPVTGRRIAVDVDPDRGVVAISPDSAVLSFLAAPDPFTGDVISGFCRWIHFLADTSAGEAWLAGGDDPVGERPAMILLRPEEGFALGERTNRALFGPALDAPHAARPVPQARCLPG